MLVEIDETAPSSRLKLSGRLDISTARSFHAVVEELLRRGAAGDIEVDLRAVNYIDSSGMGKLVQFGKRARECGRAVILLAPQPHIARQLAQMHIDRLLSVRSDS